VVIRVLIGGEEKRAQGVVMSVMRIIANGSTWRRGMTHEEGDGSIEVGNDDVLGILVLCLVYDWLAHDGV
jgi:hypothetical protein